MFGGSASFSSPQQHSTGSLFGMSSFRTPNAATSAPAFGGSFTQATSNAPSAQPFGSPVRFHAIFLIVLNSFVTFTSLDRQLNHLHLRLVLNSIIVALVSALLLHRLIQHSDRQPRLEQHPHLEVQKVDSVHLPMCKQMMHSLHRRRIHFSKALARRIMA